MGTSPDALLGDLLAVAGGALAGLYTLAGGNAREIMGTGTMSPLLVSMIILLEIPGAALLAALFLGETLPAGTYAGLGLILVGLAVVVAGQRRQKPGLPATAKLAELGTD